MYILFNLFQLEDILKIINVRDFQNELRNFFYTFNADLILEDYYRILDILTKYFVELLKLQKKTILGIKPLRRALLAVRKNEAEVTIFHRYFAFCCLKSKCYSLSLDIINNPSLKFPATSGQLIYDMINYHYYRGMLFTGLEMYQEAFQCFKLVIETPHVEIHAMQIEAAKKLLLLHQLLNKDKDLYEDELKELMQNNPWQSVYMMTCRPYMRERRISDPQWIENSIEEICQSGNLGLIKLVSEKKKFEFLEDLSQTYIMLSLSDV